MAGRTAKAAPKAGIREGKTRASAPDQALTRPRRFSMRSSRSSTVMNDSLFDLSDTEFQVTDVILRSILRCADVLQVLKG
jgi:hypothetical protein